MNLPPQIKYICTQQATSTHTVGREVLYTPLAIYCTSSSSLKKSCHHSEGCARWENHLLLEVSNPVASKIIFFVTKTFRSLCFGKIYMQYVYQILVGSQVINPYSFNEDRGHYGRVYGFRPSLLAHYAPLNPPYWLYE